LGVEYFNRSKDKLLENEKNEENEEK